MRSKIPLLIGVTLLALCLAFELQEVRALAVLEAFDSPARNLGDSGLDLNFKPVEDYFPNLTLRTGYHRFKPIFPIDYSISSPDNEDHIASDPTGVNSAVSTIPEFLSILILPLFMAITALGAMILKRRRMKN